MDKEIAGYVQIIAKRGCGDVIKSGNAPRRGSKGVTRAKSGRSSAPDDHEATERIDSALRSLGVTRPAKRR